MDANASRPAACASPKPPQSPAMPGTGRVPRRRPDRRHVRQSSARKDFQFWEEYAGAKTRPPMKIDALNGGETALRGVCTGVCSQNARARNSDKMGVSCIFWRTLSPPATPNSSEAAVVGNWCRSSNRLARMVIVTRCPVFGRPSGLQVARIAAIRLSLPTMFITRVRL